MAEKKILDTVICRSLVKVVRASIGDKIKGRTP